MWITCVNFKTFYELFCELELAQTNRHLYELERAQTDKSHTQHLSTFLESVKKEAENLPLGLN